MYISPTFVYFKRDKKGFNFYRNTKGAKHKNHYMGE